LEASWTYIRGVVLALLEHHDAVGVVLERETAAMPCGVIRADARDGGLRSLTSPIMADSQYFRGSTADADRCRLVLLTPSRPIGYSVR
jgi:hypothetical protein